MVLRLLKDGVAVAVAVGVVVAFVVGPTTVSMLTTGDTSGGGGGIGGGIITAIPLSCRIGHRGLLLEVVLFGRCWWRSL